MAGIVVATALALAGVGAAGAAAEATLPTGFESEVLFSGLNEPTNFRVAPDGRTFVALKNGEIKVFAKGAGPGSTPETFADLRKQVMDWGDRGLLGLALDPRFDEGRPYVYALYTYDHELGSGEAAPRWGQPPSYEGDPCPEAAEHGCPVSGRLVRLTASGSHASPSATEPQQKILVEGWCQQFQSHSIGDLEFGPEGALFVTGGDGASFVSPDYGQFGNLCQDPPDEGGSLRAQSLKRPSGPIDLNGALLRVDPETGEGWPGNPLAASPDRNARRILADGFRNPFRFTIDQRTDEVFVNNVGNDAYEEIDRMPIEATSVYDSGWPCLEGLEPNPAFERLELPACQRLYDSPGSTAIPFFYYDHGEVVVPGDTCGYSDGSAISGSAFYEGSAYPSAYHDALFFADSVRGCIYVMYANAEGEPDPSRVEEFLSEPGVYPGVQLQVGPQGEILYDSLVAGTINRIAYDPGAPQARLHADHEWGTTPLKVEFDAGESASPAGDSLSYAWDLDGDGEFDDGTGATQTHTYSAASNVTVAVKVTDQANGRTAIARTTIYPGDSPPKVEITKPEESLTWGVDQPIQFAGTAVENGGKGSTVPVYDLYWKVRLLHCPFGPTMCHEHPLQVFPGVNSGEIDAPDHDYPSYLHFLFTATDRRGLSAETSVKITARPVPLQLRSVPSGIALVAGADSGQTPFELTAIESSPTTLAAPETAMIGGTEYTFDHWSDGGTRLHSVLPSGPAEYTAYYDAVTGPLPSVPPASGAATAAPMVPPAGTPRPWFKLRPAAKTQRRTARFVFASEADGYRCRLDGGEFVPCRSPRVYRHLALGPHVFRVYAVDGDGQAISAVSRYEWRVSPPTAVRNTAPRPR